jgi:hypothetical protein
MAVGIEAGTGCVEILKDGIPAIRWVAKRG